MRRPIIALLCQLACCCLLAAGPAVAFELKHDEPVYVVAHSAVDCPVCKIWRASSTGLPLAQKLSETWPNVHFVLIERHSLNGSENETLYPPELRALFDDRKARYQLSPATPLFEIVLRDRVVLRLAGLQAWNEQVIPSIEQLERSREGAPTAAGQ